MGWVSDCWGAESGYNTKRSAFWRVIQRVTSELNIADVEKEDWPSYLIWSNLYKVSPAGEKGGNPSEFLCNLQFDHCAKLIEQELQQWKPKKILMLTGINWAESFLEQLGFDFSVSAGTDYVDASCKIEINGTQTAIVIAKHPQGKNEDDWVNEVISEFSALG